jgi:hypothetical protein
VLTPEILVVNKFPPMPPCRDRNDPELTKLCENVIRQRPLSVNWRKALKALNRFLAEKDNEHRNKAKRTQKTKVADFRTAHPEPNK